MHAGSPDARQRARTPHRVEINEKGVAEVAARHGLKTFEEIANFFGLAATTWSRLMRGLINPGEEIIAAVLGSHPEDPEITFDALFKVVTP